MFKKFPAARTNNSESCSPERFMAGARTRRDKRTLHDDWKHFPSHLRLFGIFFGLLISESYWGTPRLLASCCRRFHTAQANMAFL
jgi:hypothetical protein